MGVPHFDGEQFAAESIGATPCQGRQTALRRRTSASVAPRKSHEQHQRGKAVGAETRFRHSIFFAKLARFSSMRRCRRDKDQDRTPGPPPPRTPSSPCHGAGTPLSIPCHDAWMPSNLPPSWDLPEKSLPRPEGRLLSHAPLQARSSSWPSESVMGLEMSRLDRRGECPSCRGLCT